MMYGTFPDGHRARLIEGLHALASYLEARPELPVPHASKVAVSVLFGTDEEKKAEIQRIARLIGSDLYLSDPDQGHYSAATCFGPVEYSVTAITDAGIARWDAWWSYRNSITPDPPPPGA
ncbi:hypothetical protein [Nonomuraea sp. NPDC001699]